MLWSHPADLNVKVLLGSGPGKTKTSQVNKGASIINTAMTDFTPGWQRIRGQFSSLMDAHINWLNAPETLLPFSTVSPPSPGASENTPCCQSVFPTVLGDGRTGRLWDTWWGRGSERPPGLNLGSVPALPRARLRLSLVTCKQKWGPVVSSRDNDQQRQGLF